MRWTKPYYGIEHCEFVIWPHQATVTNRITFAEAHWFNFNSLRPFSPEEKIFRGPNAVEDAKAWLEKKASS